MSVLKTVTVTFATELTWHRQGYGYVAEGAQASYEIARSTATGNWQAFVTVPGKETYCAPWREAGLSSAKASCLAEEYDLARKAVTTAFEQRD